jgi:hypothetical protein
MRYFKPPSSPEAAQPATQTGPDSSLSELHAASSPEINTILKTPPDVTPHTLQTIQEKFVNRGPFTIGDALIVIQAYGLP